MSNIVTKQPLGSSCRYSRGWISGDPGSRYRAAAVAAGDCCLPRFSFETGCQWFVDGAKERSLGRPGRCWLAQGLGGCAAASVCRSDSKQVDESQGLGAEGQFGGELKSVAIIAHCSVPDCAKRAVVSRQSASVPGAVNAAGRRQSTLLFAVLMTQRGKWLSACLPRSWGGQELTPSILNERFTRFIVFVHLC